jgi:hypothetical protein
VRYRGIADGEEKEEEDKGAIGIFCLCDCSFDTFSQQYLSYRSIGYNE